MSWNDQINITSSTSIASTILGLPVKREKGYCNNFSDMNINPLSGSYAILGAFSTRVYQYDENFNVLDSKTWTELGLNGQKVIDLINWAFNNEGEMFPYSYVAFNGVSLMDIDADFPNKIKLVNTARFYNFTDERPSPYSNIGVGRLEISQSVGYELNFYDIDPKYGFVAVATILVLILWLLTGNVYYTPALADLVDMVHTKLC